MSINSGCGGTRRQFAFVLSAFAVGSSLLSGTSPENGAPPEDGASPEEEAVLLRAGGDPGRGAVALERVAVAPRADLVANWVPNGGQTARIRLAKTASSWL